MSILYINDYGVVVGMSDGRCKATLQEQCIASIPLEQLEGIVILGQAQLTTALTEYCLLNGIAVSYFSRGGTYFGKLESAAHVNVPRQRLQCSLYDTEFALELSRSLIMAKMHNQRVVLKRYEASKNQDCAAEKKMITVSCEKAKKQKTDSHYWDMKEQRHVRIFKAWENAWMRLFTLRKGAGDRR